MPVRSLWFALLLAAGCSKSNPTVEANVAKGEEIFAQRCVLCHGSTGHGDGPAAVSLDPKPRQFADLTWQAKVTDDEIEKIIKVGGAAVGKSPSMPPNPDLDDPQVVAGLRSVVRGFGKH